VLDFLGQAKKVSLADVLGLSQKVLKRRCVPEWTKCPKRNVPKCPMSPNCNIKIIIVTKVTKMTSRKLASDIKMYGKNNLLKTLK